MAYTAIDDAGSNFNTVIWTGADNTLTRSFTGVGFQPDACWYHGRNVAYNGAIWDAVRGAGAEKDIIVNTDAIEGAGDWNEYGYVGSFDSDGFTGTKGSISNGYFNNATYTYLMWNWKAGTTTGIDTTGSSITPSAYSLNQDAGFSIIKYTGNGGASGLIPHGLGTTPEFMFIKNLDYANDWAIYHKYVDATAPEDYYMKYTTAARTDSATRWNDTAPTSVLFTVGSDSTVNDSYDYIAYCFTGKQGYSNFGSYEGNGNADGTVVYTGFRPAFVMCKDIDSTSDWLMFDNKRIGFNVANYVLEANATTVEATTVLIDILSNGFKFRSTANPNTSSTYIYAAFAESPFVNSNSVPTNAR
jgi:hypothetical protein